MRLIKLSMALPVLALVSANLDRHHRRAGHAGQGGQLVARQRSSGVLGSLVGGDDEELSTTAPSSPSASSVVTPTRSTSVSTTDDEDTISPTAAPSGLQSSITPSSSITRSSSASSVVSTGQDVASSSSSASTVSSVSESNTTSAEPSTSSSSSMSVEPSMSLSVDAGGETVIVTVMQSIVTEPASRSSAPASASSTPAAKQDDNNGLAIPLSAVIGISVGAGIVVLLLIALAIWRMKRRSVDEDDAIRWPELNRHGDSDAHHALPAVQTGKHGIDDNGLERSNSNSSSVFHASSVAPPYGVEPTHMALNGSGFGASSTLDDDYYQEKTSAVGQSQHDPYNPQSHVYDLDTDYTSYPPAVQPQSNPGAHGAYDPDSDDEMHRAGGPGAGVGAGGGGHVTYPVYR